MYIFFENGARRGISYISNRYSKANNKYLKSYDPKQESKHIIYLDKNTLYGYAMSKFLPTRGFKWLDPKEFDLNNVCCLTIIIIIINNYHNKCCLIINYKITDFYNIPIGNVKKLVPNFFDKEKYLLHYENLQLYLRLGLKLIKNTSGIRIQSITMVKTIY